MKSVEELEQELYESEASSEGLAEAVAGSRVTDLVEVVSKVGKMRGHITGLTPRQYEKFIGRKPPQKLLMVARDATTKKVPWHLVLDQLATERGYKSDEALKVAIEKAKEDIAELDKAKSAQRYLRSEIIDKLRAEPEVETVKLDDECPQFPETVCSAEVTMVNGATFRLRRQHSYWRLDVGDDIIRVRYAKDARKLARIARQGYQEDIREARVVKLKRKVKRKSRPRRSVPFFKGTQVRGIRG